MIGWKGVFFPRSMIAVDGNCTHTYIIYILNPETLSFYIWSIIWISSIGAFHFHPRFPVILALNIVCNMFGYRFTWPYPFRALPKMEFGYQKRPPRDVGILPTWLMGPLQGNQDSSSIDGLALKLANRRHVPMSKRP